EAILKWSEPFCAPGSQDAGTMNYDTQWSYPNGSTTRKVTSCQFCALQRTFVHCRIPNARHWSQQAGRRQVLSPILGPNPGDRRPQAFRVVASIAARPTICPISLACSASERICDCT